MFPIISSSTPLVTAIPRAITGGTALLTGLQITACTVTLIFAAIFVISVVAILVIRHINSKETTYSPLLQNSNETDKELVPEPNPIIEEEEEEEEEVDYYNTIQLSRTPSILNPSATIPKPLSIKAPSQRILDLQKILFCKEKPTPTVNCHEPRLQHLTKDRPRPPGRAPSRIRVDCH
ncbi:MAG: hypothetical protein VX777_09935 [Chlamydiota bacterium]|nr:hypothetical protein [Chlamydiota bacterium]